MKRIYSIAFVAGAILSAASCQKEIVNEPLQNGGDFTITATTVADTKTVLDDVNDLIYWAPGDKIAVFDASNKEVAFSTSITKNATSAKFTNDAAFTAPASLVAAYPYRGAYEFDGTTVSNFRIAGGQTAHTAVAGSFDPTYAGAIGLPVSAGSTELQFTSVHALMKFTVGGEVAPSTVTITNDGGRMIAGLYSYNITTGKTVNTGSATTITLNGPFEVGETYYIPVIPDPDASNTYTLAFDGIPAKTSKSVKTEPNKIYNLGTVQKPEAAAVTATKLWSVTVPFTGGQSRNMTMDSEYVYVAQAAGGNGVIKAYNIADGSYAKDVKVTTYTSNWTIEDETYNTNGTHAISCVRMLPNTDPSVNNGKPVLVASNLATGSSERLTIYVWSNGIDADPNYYVIDNGARRLGDKFTVKGTYQSGELHFFDFNDGNIVIRVSVANGVVGSWGKPELNYATGRYTMPLSSAYNIGECTIHPNATFDASGNPTDALLITNAKNGFFTQTEANTYSASAWQTDPNLTQTWGYQFFSYGTGNYIAYVKINEARSNASLNIIKDVNGANDLQATLEAKKGLFTVDLLETAAADNTAGHGVGDCATVEVDGVRYIAVMGQNMNVALYKLD